MSFLDIIPPFWKKLVKRNKVTDIKHNHLTIYVTWTKQFNADLGRV